MSEWKDYKLGKTGKVLTGKTPSKDNPEDWGFETPFITPSDYKHYGKTAYTSIRMLSSIGADRQKNRLLPARSILVTCIGSDMGKSVVNAIPCVTNQQINAIIPDNSVVDNDYVYYQTVDLYETLRSLGGDGTAVPILNKSDFENIDILLPPLPEQQAIATVLSSLDGKIDLLHRQNKTLEAMAETLFRQWFIEEADEGWEVGTLGDILESIESGSRPKGGIDPALKDGIPSIGAENINGLGVYDFTKTKFITPAFFKSMKRGIIKYYDVLIYKDGAYVGRKGMFADGFPYEICTVNEHVFILRTNSRVNQFFLYFLLQEEELAQLNANSAQPGLNQEAMKSFELIIPPIELIHQFEVNVKSLIDKIFFNCNQIHTLTKLRDALLPKLMSGEVRVAV